MLIKILVVDDSASDRLIIKSMLGDYSILTAGDGAEALQMLEKHEGINLMILDLKMPNMDGFQVLEALKADDRYNNLRTIILTNYDEIDNEIKGLKQGAVDYIRKPIHMDSLKARIDVHAALLRTEHTLKEKLYDQTLSFEVIFEQAPIGIAISSSMGSQLSDEAIVKINSMYERITGRTKEELINTDWAKITHPDDLAEEMNKFKKLQAGDINYYSMEKRLIKPDGSIVWTYLTVAALTRKQESLFNYICLIQDISERKKIEAERKYISEHDRLTGLYNRDYLEMVLEKDAKQQIARAVVGINLNTVQLLTANYGYHHTQNLIKNASDALVGYCTDKRMLFKTHENRFVFYLKDYKDKNELIEFSEAIAETLEDLFVTDRIGGRIGILEIDKDNALNVDLLLKRLLIATERATNIFNKDFGYCFYNKELEELVNRETDLRQELSRIAASDDCGELFLQYQPIFDLKTNTICGFETLARIRTEKLGLVPPLEFIPIAEKTKLIIPIGEKVIIKALSFLNRLKEDGFEEISISINVSVVQLLRPDFTDRLLEIINEMQADPAKIGIEITESIFTSDYEVINSIFSKLRDAGLAIAIDDFGSGYSSLAREKELKVNRLKIDKYFIDRLIGTDPEKVITGDIISMAHKLGHCAVAEGVEHEAQKRYLEAHGCDKIQGFLISRPLDEEAAIKLLKNQSDFNEGIC